MKFSKYLFLGSLVGLSISNNVLATVIYDGVTANINTLIPEDVELENSATVNVLIGATIQPPYDPLESNGPEGVTVRSGSTLNVYGGAIQGAGGTTFGGDGIFFRDSGSTVTVYGGTITGSSGIGLPRGGDGISSFSSSTKTLNIHGGLIQGGDSDGTYTGDGVQLDATNVTMTGGIVRGGTGLNNVSGGDGMSMRFAGNVDINGGTIVGGNSDTSGAGNGISLDDQVVNISGGNFSGGDSLNHIGGDALSMWYGSGSLNISGGSFSGGNGGENGGDALRLVDAPVTITDGEFYAGSGSGLDQDGYALYASAMSDIDIFGGEFYGDIGGSSSIFDIHGGLFSDGELFGSGDSIFNIYGYDLAFTDNYLSGFLLDDTAIGMFVTLTSSAQLNLIGDLAPTNVPEPPIFALLSFGLAGIVVARRKVRT